MICHSFKLPEVDYITKDIREIFTDTFFLIIISVFNSIMNKSIAISQQFFKVIKDKFGPAVPVKLPYLIDTETCRLSDWPLFDPEIQPLFVDYKNKDFGCDKNVLPFLISRVNFTWIQIDFPPKGWLTDTKWQCSAQEIKRTSNDQWALGTQIGPLDRLNNFANNLTSAQLKNETNSRWDSVKVTCKEQSNVNSTFSHVIPLVQTYKHENANSKALKTNVILLGLDSISRLNFLRQMKLTRAFLESQQFIPLNGYHKVGENSLPNIVPMLTGRMPSEYYNQSWGRSRTFDNVPLIFKNFSKQGYITTFVEG